MKSKKINFFKIGVGILIIALIVGIIVQLGPLLIELNTEEGRIAFRNKIDSAGLLGILWLFGLQLAQIFLIFIPGEPMEILAGMCYGGLWGTVFIMVSAFIISTTIFLLVRKFGRPFVYQFCDRKKVKQIENWKIFKDHRKVEKILLILFFLPGTPKDLLVYISGLLPIKPIRFILISSLARFPSVISSTLAGEHLLLGNFEISVLIYGITFLIVGAILFIMNKMDKSKITEETLNTLKQEKM